MTGHEALVQSLVDDGVLRTPRVIAAFRAIDRADFVPSEFRAEAYCDYPLSIPGNQTISQPRTVAFLLELLDPQPGNRVLDVGVGSGWTTALLSYIVERGNGHVVGLERIPELCEFGKLNVAKYNFISRNIAEIRCADATQGAFGDQLFDRILSGAAAEHRIPDVWRDAVLLNGRIVAPVADAVCMLEKRSSRAWSEHTFPGFAFVPLIER